MIRMRIVWIRQIVQHPIKIAFQKSLVCCSVILIFSLLLFISQTDLLVSRGADFWKYLNWANAFESRDIDRLRDTESKSLSPVGVPLSQWSHGTGLIFQLGKKLFNNEAGGNDVKIIGWIWMMIFWWAMALLLDKVSSGNRTLTLLGILVSYLGTHAGFCSFSYSSEALSYTCLAMMGLLVLRKQRIGIFEILTVSVLSAFLILIRLYLALYFIPVFGILYYSICFKDTVSSLKEKILKGCIPIIPLGIALFQILQVNYWMTGNWLRSPYVFGLEGFYSIDFTKPEFSAVLFHPLNGLLIYHPFYLLGALVVVVMIVKSRNKIEKVFFLTIALILFLHLYLQASWYVWWMGMLTFGMRGLGIWGVLLVPVFIRYLAVREQTGLNNAGWFIVAFLCCAWSFLFMLDGYQHFYSYHQLAMARLTRIESLYSQHFFRYLTVMIIGSAAVWYLIRNRSCQHQYLTLIVLSYLVLFTLIHHGSQDSSPVGILLKSPPFRFFSALMIPVVVTSFINLQYISFIRTSLTRVISAFFMLSFAYAAITFAALAKNTNKRIDNGSILSLDKVKKYEFVSPYQLDTILISYREYSYIHGFEEKKRLMNSFLQNMEVEGRRRLRRLIKELEAASDKSGLPTTPH